MGQRRHHSLLEVCSNTLVGFVGSYWLGLLILPLFGFEITHASNFIIVSVFTAWSILRGYIMRRLFNLLHMKGVLK